MFDEVEAVRFDRMMSNGRTKPMLLACERADGQEVEVVAKFPRFCSIPGLVREAIGAMLAHDLGLPVPEPFLVKVSAPFVASVKDPAAAAALAGGECLGFGSCRLPNGYSAWVAPGARMADPMEADALGVMAFDCWTTNGDRRTTNANLLSNGKRFAMFDHELAFMTTLNLFWKAPWVEQALMGSQPPVDHVLHSHLQRRSEYALEPVAERLLSISDARIQEYRDAMPPAWHAFDDSVDRATGLIADLRNNISSAADELKKALA